VPALTAHVANEALLNRVEGISLADALDRRDLVILRVGSEEHAGVYREAVQEHSARATLPEVAGLLRSRQSEIFAKGEEQRALVRHTDGPALAIDPQLDVRIGLLAIVCRSSGREFGFTEQ
jgi:hypothetical protein